MKRQSEPQGRLGSSLILKALLPFLVYLAWVWAGAGAGSTRANMALLAGFTHILWSAALILAGRKNRKALRKGGKVEMLVIAGWVAVFAAWILIQP